MGDKKIFIFVSLICLIGLASAFSGLGGGTLASPFNITNCTQLQEMNNNLTAHYQLVNNVDCSDTINWNSEQGFEPVGNSTNGYKFNATFNGNDYEVSNLFINRSSNFDLGLFGNVEYGNISNVGLIDMNIIGNMRVGGIVGYLSYGNIIGCYSSGDINGTSTVGGLVGSLKRGNINNSYSTMNVLGTGDYIGGLVGSQSSSATINNSYSTGNIIGDDEVGGIAGTSSNRNIIDKSYSTGNVNGSSKVGGIVGWTEDVIIKNSYTTGNISGISNVGGIVGTLSNYGNTAKVETCYSTGYVSGNSSVGGLVGRFNLFAGAMIANNSFSTSNVSGNFTFGGLIGFASGGETITNVYWYNKSQGLNCYSGGNTGCTAISDSSYFYNYENAPMNLTSGDGWNFVDVWDNILNRTNYPVLQFQQVIYIPIYPNISFVIPTTSSGENIQTFITANVSVENATSVVNLTVFLYNSSSGNLIVQNSTTSNNLFWNITGLSVGNYSLNASVEDSAGLTNQTETLKINLTAAEVPEEEPEDPPSSGGGGTSTQTQYQLGREFSEQGEQFQLRRNSEISFRHREQSHSLTLNSFTSNSCKITIESDPITATLEKDVAQEFDIEGDGVEDIEVVYQGVEGSNALIVVSKLVLVSGESEVFVNSEGGEVQETQTNQISTNELFGTSGSGSESVDVAREKTKKHKNPLRTVLISLIVMGAIIAGLYAIGKQEKKKKDHYLGFFDK